MPPTTLELLWRHERPLPLAPRRGPKPRLSVDAVVGRAVALADEGGADAVRIRRVARSLAVSAMAVYTYVESRDQLVQLMVDQVLGAMPSPVLTGRWVEDLRAVADANLALHLQHPWLTAVTSDRPALGPGTLGKYERELLALEPLGLGDVDRDAALTFVLSFVRSTAGDLAAAARVREESQQTTAAWWEANASTLATFVSAQRFPLAVRVGEAAGAHLGAAYDARHAYEFGMARIVEALESLRP